jgi:hypothetical protein
MAKPVDQSWYSLNFDESVRHRRRRREVEPIHLEREAGALVRESGAGQEEGACERHAK